MSCEPLRLLVKVLSRVRDDETRFISLLPIAVAELTPVLVRSAHGGTVSEANIESYVDGRLRIGPIRTKLFEQSEQLVVVIKEHALRAEFADFEIIDESTIELNPARAAVARLAERGRWEGRSCSLFVPAGVDGIYLLPIVSLSSEGCMVRTERGLPPGQTLEQVEILGESGILRRCNSEVVENVPWCDQMGQKGYRSRLALVDHTSVSTPVSILSEADRIAEILRVCVALSITVRASDGSSGYFEGVNEDGSVRLKGHGLPSGRHSTLSFELFGTLYRYRARLISQSHSILVLTPPVVLQIVGRRKARRVDVRDEHVLVSLLHPLHGHIELLRAMDMSTGGISLSDPENHLYWPAMPVDDLRVEVNGKSHALGRAVVAHASDQRVNITFRGEVPPEFHSSVIAIRRPDLPVHDGKDFDGQIDFYRRRHLLLPYMEEALEAHKEECRETWRTVHSVDDVMRTFSRREGPRVVASVTASLAWEGTWFGQQLAADRERQGCSPGQLLLTFLDHVVPRSDCSRMLFCSTRGNQKMTEIHEHFASLTGTQEAMTRTEIDIWVTKHRASSTSTRVVIRTADSRDLAMIENASIREFGHEGAEALSLTRSTIRLESLAQRYGSLGLRRDRKLLIAELDNQPIFAAVCEDASRGVCLNGVLNATWLIPLRRFRADGDVAAQALSGLLSHLGVEGDDSSRVFVVPVGMPTAAFEAVGATKDVMLNMFVLNRAGLLRYFDFLDLKYGSFTTTLTRDIDYAAAG